MVELTPPEKKLWESKTIWVSAITAVLSFNPQASDWIKGHPEFYSSIIAVVMCGLRLITSSKVKL